MLKKYSVSSGNIVCVIWKGKFNHAKERRFFDYLPKQNIQYTMVRTRDASNTAKSIGAGRYRLICSYWGQNANGLGEFLISKKIFGNTSLLGRHCHNTQMVEAARKRQCHFITVG
jgi:hypothetical protein